MRPTIIMHNYNFDQIIDRKGSGDIKHDALKPRWGRDDLLPLWVADMDFATPPFIVDALRKRLEHPIFGYTATPDELWQSIIDWQQRQHQWTVQRQWLSYIPGIVKGIGFVINVFTRPGEKVIIQPPVYHPFRLTPLANGREVVFNPLKCNAEGYYEMDFDNLEAVCDEQCKVFVLCNPHNPAGQTWSKETLHRLADFCYERNILVISDEIHADMALFGNRHTPFATVSQRAADISITFGAPSKTFNMAGIVSSFAIVPNAELRTKFFRWLAANELNEPTIFAPIATIAAFTQGDEWRKQMLKYIEGNVLFVEAYCKKHIPGVKPLRPQASFLVWLDFTELKLDHAQLLDLCVDKAHLAMNDGEMFGPGGESHMRLNVGTPRAILQQALEQLAKAVKSM